MKQYIEQNKERFFDELFSLLRIPSISSESAHRPDMYRCAERLVELLKEAGASILVAGSSVFNAADPAEAIALLRGEKHIC